MILPFELWSGSTSFPKIISFLLWFFFFQPFQRFMLPSFNESVFNLIYKMWHLQWYLFVFHWLLVTLTSFSCLLVIFISSTNCCLYSLPSFPVDLSVFLELSHGIVLCICITFVCNGTFFLLLLLFLTLFSCSDLEKSCQKSTKNHSLDWNSLNVSVASFYHIVNNHIHLSLLVDCFFFSIFIFCWPFVSII